MRWLRSGSRRDQARGSQLESVRIFTPELALDGFVAPTGQRITDILLRGQDLAFLPAGASAAPDKWVRIAPADLLAVIPPAIAAPHREWQQSRRQIEAFAEVGPYRITGMAHLRRGETLDDGFRARQPFLPLTSATVQRAGGEPQRVDVAIVNLDNADLFGPAVGG
jgi:hypothetical protein